MAWHGCAITVCTQRGHHCNHNWSQAPGPMNSCALCHCSMPAGQRQPVSPGASCWGHQCICAMHTNCRPINHHRPHPVASGQMPQQAPSWFGLPGQRAAEHTLLPLQVPQLMDACRQIYSQTASKSRMQTSWIGFCTATQAVLEPPSQCRVGTHASPPACSPANCQCYNTVSTIGAAAHTTATHSQHVHHHGCSTPTAPQRAPPTTCAAPASCHRPS